MQDPLITSLSSHQQALKDQLQQVCSGKPTDIVLGAAINLVCNAVRQSYHKRERAEARFDELVGKAKAMLLDHYDRSNGRAFGAFPYDQTIHMPTVTDRDRRH